MFFAIVCCVIAVLVAGVASVIGYYAFDLIEPWLRGSNYWSAYEQAVAWFHRGLIKSR